MSRLPAEVGKVKGGNKLLPSLPTRSPGAAGGDPHGEPSPAGAGSGPCPVAPSTVEGFCFCFCFFLSFPLPPSSFVSQ